MDMSQTDLHAKWRERREIRITDEPLDRDWVIHTYEISEWFSCSNCGGYEHTIIPPRYCRYCGARMDRGWTD